MYCGGWGQVLFPMNLLTREACSLDLGHNEQALREGTKNSRSPSVQRSESSSDISGRKSVFFFTIKSSISLVNRQSPLCRVVSFDTDLVVW